jgi:hypothetical protein
MKPLEKLTATAARLVQMGEAERGALGNRLKESAAAIRCSVAEIRNALEGKGTKGRHPKFDLIVGDEGGPANG